MEQYKSFREHLEQAEGLQPVNEILMTLIAGSVLAWTCAPLLNTDFMKNISAGLGATFAGLGSLFGLGKKDDKDKDKGKNNGDKDKTKTPSTENKPSESDPNDDLQEIVPKALGAATVAGDDKAKTASQDIMDILTNPDGTMKKLPLNEEDQKKLNNVVEKHNIEKLKSVEDFEKVGQRVNDDLRNASQKDPNFLRKTETQTADMRIAAAENAQKKEQEDIEKEYKEKIEKESDPDKKKALEKERDDKIAESKKKLETAKANIKKELQPTEPNSEPRDDTNTNPNPEPRDDTNTNPKPEPKKETTADKIQKQIDGHKKNKQKIETEIKELEKKAEKSGGDVKKNIEKQISQKQEQVKAIDKKIAGAEKALDKAKSQDAQNDEEKEEHFQVTHNGKPDVIIKRPSKAPGAEGESVYCYKSDQEKTISKDEAEALIKKSKETNESLSDWLSWWCISL